MARKLPPGMSGISSPPVRSRSSSTASPRSGSPVSSRAADHASPVAAGIKPLSIPRVSSTLSSAVRHCELSVARRQRRQRTIEEETGQALGIAEEASFLDRRVQHLAALGKLAA